MEAGIQAINSAHDEVMSITMKSQKTLVTYEQVEESIKQLTMGCKDLHDRINEYQQREDIWILDCSAQLELIDLITEHGKELERVRDELNQTDMQCRQACDQFKAGTWRDFSNIHEHSEEQRKEWKKNAECQLEQWKQIGESIRMQKITDHVIDLFRLDPQAREEYKAIMEEREKICEEGQDV
ncbi:uncharacterized protein LOC127850775 [Dreissena polymorpha]|uniref:Uncharacterized protein n=1 Tax=Dreissena polymorpha TaxID=45954 RepID=A0A9D4HX77_DREPO|nr:uncharacterized protein LOC127850775 [Dreissena polymorpha]KAH3738640.1 hypothetical protein DPMN_045279 [Dreissena polymorpha]